MIMTTDCHNFFMALWQHAYMNYTDPYFKYISVQFQILICIFFFVVFKSDRNSHPDRILCLVLGFQIKINDLFVNVNI